MASHSPVCLRSHHQYLYTLTVIILVINWKHFDIYFFKLYVYQFFFNMLMYWNYYPTSRLPTSTCSDCPLSQWLSTITKTSQSSFPLHIFVFGQYHFGFSNYTNVLMTSFNRLTMIYMTKSYAKIWHYGSYLMIAVSLFLPLFFTYPLLTHSAYFEYNPGSDTFVFRTTADLSQTYSVLLLWIIIMTGLNVAANVACWWRISKYSQLARQKSEYRLFLMSFVTFLIQLFVFAIAIINKLSTDFDPSKKQFWSQIGQVLSPFGNDVMTLSPPIILVVFSKKIRKTVKLLFTQRSLTSISITPVQNLRLSKTAASPNT